MRQRSYVHFLRDGLDYLARKVADDCLIELRWLYDRRNAEEARRDLAAWLLHWQEKYPKLCAWVEENIEETLTFYRLPREHHKHLKSTNMLGGSIRKSSATPMSSALSFPPNIRPPPG